jgi:hypothetical protein
MKQTRKGIILDKGGITMESNISWEASMEGAAGKGKIYTELDSPHMLNPTTSWLDD